ncbi:MAG: transporter [Syntrophales bacterium]|nr:transporter [Syntrophales bacterium]
MNVKGIVGVFFCWAVLTLPVSSWAGHPLITDDTGTQGTGKFQLELTGQYDEDKDTAAGVSVETTGKEVGTTLSYGLVENVDLVLSLPYQWGKTEEGNVRTYDEKGVSDMAFEAKWRFFEKEGFSLAFKPGISIPTGNDEKGLGTGNYGYQVFWIGSKKIAPWAFHANLGYIRNENKVDEQRNIWHASLATTWEVVKNLNLVANIGMERNPDDSDSDSDSASNDPAFIIGGVIYSVTENFDVDCGVKYGLNSSETDTSLMAGMAFRF